MQLSLQTEKLGSNSISLEQFKWFSYRSLLLYLQLHLVLILKMLHVYLCNTSLSLSTSL